MSRHCDDLDAVLEFDALDDFGQLINLNTQVGGIIPQLSQIVSNTLADSQNTAAIASNTGIFSPAGGLVSPHRPGKHQSYPDCIIATRGYDFREGQMRFDRDRRDIFIRLLWGQ